MSHARLRTTCLLVFAMSIPGCAVHRDSGVRAASTLRDARFAAAKDVLREFRFTLNRVDARAGILTTHPKATSGWATPWDREQSTSGDETEDLLHAHRRLVRIRFLGEDYEVSAWIERERAVGQRLSPRAIALTTTSIDDTPANSEGGLPVEWVSVVRRDDALASRIRQRIEERVRASGTVSGGQVAGE